MKRLLRFSTIWLSMAVLLFGFIPVAAPQVVAADEASDEMYPGEVRVNKTAQATNTPGEWKVTLTVEGKNRDMNADVVLVIDRSGSMDEKVDEDDTKRITKAKSAAKTFVDNLLPTGSTNRVAIVSFGPSATTESTFKTSSTTDVQALKTAINGVSASGGTNIQAGLHKAQSLFSSSTADNKAIILLSDGAPTYSYSAGHASAYSNWNGNNHNFRLYDFDYDDAIGNGSSYTLNSSYMVDSYTVADHGIATISEGWLASQTYKVYSVGVDVGNNSDAVYVLTNSANNGYFPADSSNLEDIYVELANRMFYAAEDAVVVDPLGDMFNLGQVSDISYSAGTSIVWDAQSETFTWNIGTISENYPPTLSYTVKIDLTKNPQWGNLYPTNKTTTLTYTNSEGGTSTLEFPIPQVPYGTGSILMNGYRVNNAGQPIDANGAVVASPAEAAPLYSSYYTNNGAGSLLVDQTYAVYPQSVQGYTFQVGSQPTEVTLTESNYAQVVWFGYVAGSQQVTVYHKDRDTDAELKPSEVYYGNSGSNILLNAESITVTSTVYAPDGSPTVTSVTYNPEELQYSYTFTESENQMYTIYYNKENKMRNLTVKYLEQGTSSIVAPQDVVSGQVGAIVTLNAKSVSGYSVTLATYGYTFTSAADQEYIFYYKKDTYNPPYVPPVVNPPVVEPPTVKPPTLEKKLHFDYVQGYPDGDVRPNSLISREEVAAIFYRLMEEQSRASYYSKTNSFSDVSATRWSLRHVSTMQKAKIIEGYADGTFKPGRSITRAEFAAIAARFDKLDERVNTMFSDIKGHWSEKYIASAANKGWINGYTDGTFKPDQYITRAEAMKFINSVLDRQVKRSGIHKDAKRWPDNLATKWYYEDVIEATNHHDYTRLDNGFEQWESIKPKHVDH